MTTVSVITISSFVITKNYMKIITLSHALTELEKVKQIFQFHLKFDHERNYGDGRIVII